MGLLWSKRVGRFNPSQYFAYASAHFCDLSRYFGGEVDLETIMAHSVEWYEKPGQLSKVGRSWIRRGFHADRLS